MSKEHDNADLVALEAEVIKQETSWFRVLANIANRKKYPSADVRRRAAWIALFFKFVPGPGALVVSGGGVATLLFIILQTNILREQNELIQEYESSNRKFTLLDIMYREGKDLSSIKNLALDEYINAHSSSDCISSVWYELLIFNSACDVTDTGGYVSILPKDDKYFSFRKNWRTDGSKISIDLQSLDYDYQSVSNKRLDSVSMAMMGRLVVFNSTQINRSYISGGGQSFDFLERSEITDSYIHYMYDSDNLDVFDVGGEFEGGTIDNSIISIFMRNLNGDAHFAFSDVNITDSQIELRANVDQYNDETLDFRELDHEVSVVFDGKISNSYIQVHSDLVLGPEAVSLDSVEWVVGKYPGMSLSFDPKPTISNPRTILIRQSHTTKPALMRISGKFFSSEPVNIKLREWITYDFSKADFSNFVFADPVLKSQILSPSGIIKADHAYSSSDAVVN